MSTFQDPDFVANGHYHSTIKSIRIACSEVDHDASVTGYEYIGNDTQNIPVSVIVREPSGSLAWMKYDTDCDPRWSV